MTLHVLVVIDWLQQSFLAVRAAVDAQSMDVHTSIKAVHKYLASDMRHSSLSAADMLTPLHAASVHVLHDSLAVIKVIQSAFYIGSASVLCQCDCI